MVAERDSGWGCDRHLDALQTASLEDVLNEERIRHQAALPFAAIDELDAVARLDEGKDHDVLAIGIERRRLGRAERAGHHRIGIDRDHSPVALDRLGADDLDPVEAIEKPDANQAELACRGGGQRLHPQALDAHEAAIGLEVVTVLGLPARDSRVLRPRDAGAEARQGRRHKQEDPGREDRRTVSAAS